MERTMKRALVFTMIGLFLLAACAPVQAATQDTLLSEQVKELSAGLTAAAQTLQEKDQQLMEQSTALEGITQTAHTIEQYTASPSITPTSTPPQEAPTQTLNPTLAQFKTIVAAGQTKQAAFTPTFTTTNTGTPTSTSTLTPTITPGSLTDLYKFLSYRNETFDNCTYKIVSEGFVIKKLTVKRNDLLNLSAGDKVIIIQPVNLRTGPALSHRILMTLRTDPTYIASITPGPNTTPNAISTPTPGSSPTPNPNRIEYTIVGGPAYTNLGADDAPAYSDLDGADAGQSFSPYRIEGRKYKWWKIQSPDNKTTGWVVEASACGLYNFIEPVTSH